LMLARPPADNKWKKKIKNYIYIYMEKPTVKKNFIKKKKNQSLNAHLLRKMNGRMEQFCEKKKIHISLRRNFRTSTQKN
jgi:hypothetical protein